MPWFLILLLAETPQQHAARVRAQMEASLSQQRESTRKQSETVKPATPSVVPVQVDYTAAPAFPQASYVAREQPPCNPLRAPEIASLIDSASEAQNLSPSLVREVARQESGFYPCAVSSQGAAGLMQLMPATQIELGVTDPWDPRQNIEAGTRLLRQLMDRYHGDLTLALSAYNAGAGRVDRAGGVPAIPETRNYVDSILNRLFSGGEGVTGWGGLGGTVLDGP